MEAPLNPKDVTVLWHGWIRKLGRFSKRWRRRYFIFLSTSTGQKELRHYDAQKDVHLLLVSTPKGVISLTDATGLCVFHTNMNSATSTTSSLNHHSLTRKPTLFHRSESGETMTDAYDQKFAVLTPLHVHMLAFQNGKEYVSSSESQRGLSLLASLSAFYSSIDVLHTGYMSKKRERSVHSPKSIMSYWKRHYFVFLSSGDLLYFRDETYNELQGRVDVRHAPTVRVTGERMLEGEKKKESVFKFAKSTGYERENCLVWIATPPSKMFVIKLQDDTQNGNRHELLPEAKTWLSLLLQGHAQTKYTQLEQCISFNRYEPTPEIVSAVRAGIPDELRGQLWKGFAGVSDFQRRTEIKRSSTSKITKDGPITNSNDVIGKKTPLFEELAQPLESNVLQTRESQLIFSRLAAVAFREAQLLDNSDADESIREEDIDNRERHAFSSASIGESGWSTSLDIVARSSSDPDQQPSSKEAPHSLLPRLSKRNSLKQLGKSKLGDYVYPSDSASPEWEVAARRRLIIATTRHNPFSHPCPWRVSCLLLAYLDEESSFWMINSILDVYLPGYYHGYRPALQVDVAGFITLLAERAPALSSHLKSLRFSIEHTVERWFLSLFTSTYLPLPTVLRIWDAFFIQGVRIFMGVGVALFLKAEENLFRAKNEADAIDILCTTERGSIDADTLFSHVFKDDFNIIRLSSEQFDKLRATHRQQVTEYVNKNVSHFNEKLSILSQLQDQFRRYKSSISRLINVCLNDRDRGSRSNITLSQVSELNAHSDSNEEMQSLMVTLRALLECINSNAEVVATLATDLNTRQAKWLALSSQLAACPLTSGITSDLQSWLSQVREGKISGAGLDVLEETEGSGVNPRPISTIIDNCDLFFDACDGHEANRKWNCLTTRSDFASSHKSHTEAFLHAIEVSLKTACAARMECLAASHRAKWHTSHWIDSTIETSAASSRNNTTSKQRQSGTSTLMSSASMERTQRSASIAAHPFGSASMHMRNRSRTVTESSSEFSTYLQHTESAGVTEKGFEYEPSYELYMQSPYFSEDPAGISTKPGGNSSLDLDTYKDMQYLKVVGMLYSEGEQILHTAVDTMMSCFSRFIRLENRVRGWELRERALLLEDDLVQELQQVEALIQSAQQLY